MTTVASLASVYPASETQAPGTVYDCLAQNSIDQMLQVDGAGSYRDSSIFYSRVQMNPGFAHELVAVPMDNNCTCMAEITLHPAQVQSSVQTKLPVFPDFVTSAHLAVQLPGIVGRVDPAQQAARDSKSMAGQLAAGSNGAAVQASEQNGYPSLVANDECDAHSSSLALSGAGVKFDQYKNEWVPNTHKVTRLRLKTGAKFPVDIQPAITDTPATDAHEAAVIALASPVRLFKDVSLANHGLTNQLDPIQVTLKKSNVQGPQLGYTTGTSSADSDQASASFRETIIKIHLCEINKGTTETDVAAITGAAFGGKTGATGTSVAVGPNGESYIEVVQAGDGILPGAKITITEAEINAGAGFQATASPLNGEELVYTFGQEMFHTVDEVALSGAFGDLQWQPADLHAVQTAAKLQYLPGDVLLVYSNSADQVAISGGAANAPCAIKVLAVNYPGPGNRPVSWITVDAGATSDATVVPVGTFTSLPTGNSSSRPVPGGYGFKPGQKSEDAAATPIASGKSSGNAYSTDVGAPPATLSQFAPSAANTLGLVLIPAKDSTREGNLANRAYSSVAAAASVRLFAWNATNYADAIDVNPFGTVMVRHDAKFRRTHRCVPATEAIRDNIVIPEFDGTADAEHASFAGSSGVPVPKLAAAPLFATSAASAAAPGRVGHFVANELKYMQESDASAAAATEGTATMNDKVYGNVSYDNSNARRGPLPLSAQPFAHWVQGAAMRLVEQCNFYTGQTRTNTMDKCDFITMYAFEELIGFDGHRSHQLNGLGRKSREQLIRESQQQRVEYVRLPLFFTLDEGCALEVIATAWAEYMMEWKLAPHRRLIVKSNPSVKVYLSAGKGTNARNAVDDTVVKYANSKPHDLRSGLLSSAMRSSNVFPESNSNPLHEQDLKIKAYVVLGCVYLNQQSREQSVGAASGGMSHGLESVVREIQAENSGAVPVGKFAYRLGNKYVQSAGQQNEFLLIGHGGKEVKLERSSDPATNLMELVNNSLAISDTSNCQSGAQSCGITAYDQIGLAPRHADLDNHYADAALCALNGETARAYCQTIRSSAMKKREDAAIDITLVGSHPVKELLLLFQVADNGYSNDWTNFGPVVAPAFTLGQDAGTATSDSIINNNYTIPTQNPADQPRGLDATRTSIGHGDNAQPLSSLQHSRAPVKTIEVKANNNVRISKAPGAQFCRLIPDLKHSGSPDVDNNGYIYAIPIAYAPEDCQTWSGSLNQGRLTNMTVTVHFEDEAAKLQMAVHVVQRTWNIEQVTADGQGGAKFANQTTITVGAATA